MPEENPKPVRSARLVWLVPVVTLVLAAAAVIWTRWEHDWVEKNFTRAFRAHAESLSRLIAQNARQSARLLDAAYELLELRLADLARRALRPPACTNDSELAEEDTPVCLLGNGETFTGRWGPVGDRQRAGFLQLLTSAPAGDLVEEEPLASLSLACARFELEAGGVILCRHREELLGLRREAGLGRLLENLEGRGLLYVVLEDDEGPLAAAGDHALARSLAGLPAGPGFHLRDSARGKIFEARLPFTLPDESPGLLRVGVDARPLTRVQTQIERRHLAFYLAAFVLLLGSVAGALWFHRTERLKIRAAETLRRQQEETRYWQGFSQMAASVAHEVRNPLNTMGMVAKRLLREFSLPAEQSAEYRDMIGLLQGEIERVNRVVGDFMELGKPLELQPAPVALEEFIRQVLAPLQLRAAQEGKTLAVRTTAATVVIDRRRLAQVLVNLVHNALEAVSSGGRVETAARLEGRSLTIQVGDNGPGMTGEQLARAGQPFFTTKGRGTGLGLALSRRIVEAHGGQLAIESEPGKGTRVTFRIPQDERGQS